MMASEKRWNLDEVRELRRMYGSMDDGALAHYFGRELEEIRDMARQYALRKNKASFRGKTVMPRWTRTETATLEAEYATTPNLELARRLGRSERSVVAKACRLGLAKDWRRLAEMGRENVRLRADRGGRVL